MTADLPAAEPDPDRPRFTSMFLLFDPAGELLCSETVSGWNPAEWDAIERLDRRAREIGGILVPIHGARDYRRPTA